MFALRFFAAVSVSFFIWVGSAQVGTFLLGPNLGFIAAVLGMFLGAKCFVKILSYE